MLVGWQTPVGTESSEHRPLVVGRHARYVLHDSCTIERNVRRRIEALWHHDGRFREEEDGCGAEKGRMAA